MSVLEPTRVLLRPIFTERTELQRETENKVSFVVNQEATKSDIRNAVETLLNLKVSAVNTMIYRGKVSRRGRHEVKRPNWKKAIVTLQPGQDLAVLSLGEPDFDVLDEDTE